MRNGDGDQGSYNDLVLVQPLSFEKSRTSYKVVLVPIQSLVVPCTSPDGDFLKTHKNRFECNFLTVIFFR